MGRRIDLQTKLLDWCSGLVQCTGLVQVYCKSNQRCPPPVLIVAMGLLHHSFLLYVPQNHDTDGQFKGTEAFTSWGAAEPAFVL